MDLCTGNHFTAFEQASLFQAVAFTCPQFSDSVHIHTFLFSSFCELHQASFSLRAHRLSTQKSFLWLFLMEAVCFLIEFLALNFSCSFWLFVCFFAKSRRPNVKNLSSRKPMLQNAVVCTRQRQRSAWIQEARCACRYLTNPTFKSTPHALCFVRLVKESMWIDILLNEYSLHRKGFPEYMSEGLVASGYLRLCVGHVRLCGLGNSQLKWQF